MVKIFKSRAVRITAFILAAALFILATLEIGTLLVGALWRPWTPDYERESIDALLDKTELEDADYELLFRQTGLSRLGVDGLIESGREEYILEIQDSFFAGGDYFYNVFAPFTGIFRTKSRTSSFAMLENGDILYCPASYFSFVRLGHISIVINEKFRTVAESQGYENDYETTSAYNFLSSPAFVILRVNASKDIRDSAALYTRDFLSDTEYRISAGLFGEKAPSELKYTHCSHMIWYTYQRLGIDLDANGGPIVTPDDIFNSEQVSIVQIFGMDIDKITQK